MKKLIFSMALLAGLSATAQIDTPQPSPLSKVEQNIGLTSIEIEYSRPGVKGRTIFGDLVPFGEMWRTGANASTKITLADKVNIGGVDVEKGTYALYTIPGENEWEVIIHKNTTYWGTGGADYKKEEDAARFKVKAVKSNTNVENLTIGFDNLKDAGADLVLAWAKTKVVIPVKTNTDEKVMAQIEAFTNPKPNYRPYYNAASYFYNNDKDLNKALEWASKATELKSDGFWVYHLKAKIQLKNGDKKGAKATAEKSKELAQAAGNNDYVALNDKLIAKCK